MLGRDMGAFIFLPPIGRGTGPIPVLLLAPGGMRSHEGQWGLQPYDPLYFAAARKSVSISDYSMVLTRLADT